LRKKISSYFLIQKACGTWMLEDLVLSADQVSQTCAEMLPLLQVCDITAAIKDGLRSLWISPRWWTWPSAAATPIASGRNCSACRSELRIRASGAPLARILE
jgi:hypothetical protein